MFAALLPFLASAGGGALAAGALSTLGGIYTNKANSALNASNMNWQTDMSNTAYQRAMADMRKAGLNPILAANRGGATWGNPAQFAMQNPLAGASQMASSAVQVAKAPFETEKMHYETEKIQEEILSERQRNGDISGKQKGLIADQASAFRAQAALSQTNADMNSILLEFYESQEWAKLVKDTGLAPTMLKGIFSSIFLRR